MGDQKRGFHTSPSPIHHQSITNPSQTIIMATIFTRDEYDAAREKQDIAIRREFGVVHGHLDEMRDETAARFGKIDERFDKIDERFDKIDDRFDKMRDEFDELKVDVKRSQAVAYNARIRNPVQPIRPIPPYRPGHGLVPPKYFPKDANTLVNLANHHNDAALVYLARFYEISGYEAWGNDCEMDSTGDETDSADDKSDSRTLKVAIYLSKMP
ncbi:hypothetical protein B0H67DRAFT_659384 [Lasiosphaeris hirsuta]|uniref:Uncharacterized protein n=1 Tax=Lasiosphaeris hirsuta TaxID=260670 RepID=A0AA40B0Z2_9PEZI|nr:hypothetical protein B0H67DRAFT_659384 [Lasiosphaeris hirsuta]